MTEDSRQEISFITCPVCHGSGFDEQNFPCRNCAAMGEGTFLNDKFIFWGWQPNLSSGWIRRLRIILNGIIDLAAVMLFFGGLTAMIIWLAGNSDLLNNPILLTREKNVNFLLFWFGLLALIFLIYRADQKKQIATRLKPFRTSKGNNLPNNWDELRRYQRRFDAAFGFDEKCLEVIEEAYLLAWKKRNPEVTNLHLFRAMLRNLKIAVLFTRLNVSGRDLAERLDSQISRLPQTLKRSTDLKISLPVKEALIAGFLDAYRARQKSVNELNLILPILARDESIREILLDLKIDDDKLRNTLAWFKINEWQIANFKRYRKLAGFKPKTAMDRAYTAVATPLLNSFGYDLTLAAKWGRLQLCVAREKEIAAAYEAWESGRNGVLLTGPVGSGKKSIIEGIAREMVSEENIPEFLRDKRLIELDVARLVSGAAPQEAEQRLLTIIDEINRAGNIILFIENVETIIGITAGSGGSLELSEVLATQLEKGFLRCLATCSDHNYLQYVENSALARAMSRLKIIEPDKNQAIQMLESKIGYLESRGNIFFSYNAVEAAVDLSERYIHEPALPAKAIEVLEKTATRIAAEQKNKRYVCDSNDIAVTINMMTEIPVAELGKDESEKLLNLEEEIHRYMIDQEEAVKMVANSLRRARTEMREGKRPIASFLFLGPTGVGKTELAKTIARVYFAKKDLLIRLDMSEYQEETSVGKMIGDAGGQKGYLTEAVRQKPFSLILLDEFEKAHPKIFNLFLQVMDDGRLTDGDGNTVDFTNSIIIATSNAGSNYIQDEIGKGTPLEEIKNFLINQQLNQIMRPELINRFDGIIVFKPLSEDDTAEITRLMLADVRQMLKNKGIELEASEQGMRRLAQLGYDPKFGARPLRRLIQERIEDEIAKKILSKELNRRDTVVINDQAEVEVKKRREL